MFSYGNFTSLTIDGVELFALPILFSRHLSVQYGDLKCTVYMDATIKHRMRFAQAIANDGQTGALFDHEELPARYAGAIIENTEDLQTYFTSAFHDPQLPSSISNVMTVAYFLSRDTAMRLELIRDEALLLDDAVVVAIHGVGAQLVIDNICALRSEDVLDRSRVAAFFAGDFFHKPPSIFEGTARAIEHAKRA